MFSKDRPSSPSKENKATNSESKGAVLKAAKAKAQKSKTNISGQASSLSRPASSAFDITKPHWILRWVSDASCSDNIEIKKDTDRIEEIKALKKAWENHEIGRSVKAMASRHRFLRENLVKADGGAITDEELDKLNEDQDNQGSAQKIEKTKTKNQVEEKGQKGAKSKKDTKIEIKIEQTPSSDAEFPVNEEVFTDTPPTPPKPKVILPPIDIDPFIRESYYHLRIKDENFEKEQARMRKIEFDKFISFKDQMNKFREEERKYRLQQKIKQIEECEILQVN